MPAAQIQLVKWSLPAFALLIGLFWYKRRRAERADPGGDPTGLPEESTPKVERKVTGSASKVNASLSDSGIDEPFASVSPKRQRDEPSRTPRKVSESLDIPSRRSSSRHVSLDSSLDSQPWSRDPDSPLASLAVQLGSNPRTGGFASNFDSVARSRAGSSLDAAKDGDGKMVRIFESVEEEQKTEHAMNGECRKKIGNTIGVSRTQPDAEHRKNARSESPEPRKADETSREAAQVGAKNVQETAENAKSAKTNMEEGVVARGSEESAGEPEETSQGQQANAKSEEGEGRSDGINGESKVQSQALSERDSANHSPVSGVLEGSVTDEARSEGSLDSGKGGSIKGDRKDNPSSVVYEFSIPNAHVGRLIGRCGVFLQSVQSQAGVQIMIRGHPVLSREQRVCIIEGTAEGIKVALDIIRQRFPLKKYPQMTLEQISPNKPAEEVIWIVPELSQLPLVEGVNNDVVICYATQPNWLFVHLPTHPTYPYLRILDANMTHMYNTIDTPAVPDQLSKGMIVVAKWYSKWVRASVETPDPRGEQNLVKLVDYGGYWHVSNADMRKLRSDYATLPFQAIEVFLANIQPKNGEWDPDAFNVVTQMCSGIVGQAQIVGYIDSRVYVNIYYNVPPHGVISLADELVARGYAEPLPVETVQPKEDVLVHQACV